MLKRLFIMCPMLLFAASAWGSTCAASALNAYLPSGFSCTEGDFLFSNFTYTASNNLPPASAVNVAPVMDSTDVGFDLFGAWQSGAGASSDAVLSYEVSTSDKSLFLAGQTVSLISYGASGANANAQIVEGVCTTQPSGSGQCATPYSLDAFYNANGTAKQSASVTFASPSATVFVTKNIITGGDSGSAAISEFENTSQISGGGGGPGGGPAPEPGSMLMLGSGLVFTSLAIRRRRKA
jgi:hypothetical protein